MGPQRCQLEASRLGQDLSAPTAGCGDRTELSTSEARRSMATQRTFINLIQKLTANGEEVEETVAWEGRGGEVRGGEQQAGGCGGNDAPFIQS